ncbi:MAG: phenylalanine--tRNA ligase subunit alpha, partial [Gemmatimonadales bacterium]
DGPALDAEEIAILGRKQGVLTAALRGVATRPADDRRAYGAAVNQLKAAFEAAFEARRGSTGAPTPSADQVDLTMPGRRRWTGGLHPVTQVTDEIVEIFRGLGFTVATGPEAETDETNFLALNFPADHPAMDLHDTLYLDAGGEPTGPGERVLLRTHTS